MSEHSEAVEHLKAIAKYCGIDGNVRNCMNCVFGNKKYGIQQCGCLFSFLPCAFREFENELKERITELEQGGLNK